MDKGWPSRNECRRLPADFDQTPFPGFGFPNGACNPVDRLQQSRQAIVVLGDDRDGHPNLTTQKTLYLEISRAGDRAELVTDDREALRERLEAVGPEKPGRERVHGAIPEAGRDADRSAGIADGPTTSKDHENEGIREPKGADRGLGL